MRVQALSLRNMALLPIAVFCLFYTSCRMFKPGKSSGTGNKYYETFYTGNSGTQYFIKPMHFVNSAKGEECSADITFRYKNEIRDSAIVNVSFFNKTPVKNLDSITVSSGDMSLSCAIVSFMYTEKSGSYFNSRFSVKYPLSGLSKLFEQGNSWVITAVNNAGRYTYKAGRKTRKTISKVNNEIIILFR